MSGENDRSSEPAGRNICRRTHARFSAEEKIGSVLHRLRGEASRAWPNYATAKAVWVQGESALLRRFGPYRRRAFLIGSSWDTLRCINLSRRRSPDPSTEAVRQHDL